VRIKGLVTASNRVREQLKVGISAQHVEEFQQYVLTALQATEQLCAAARMTPTQLPIPSRKAYAFLKQLDLDRLPMADASAPSTNHQTITLRNVRAQQQQIQGEMSKLAGGTAGAKRSPFNPAKAQPLLETLQGNVTEIEEICLKNGLSPSHLTGISKSLYAWMKYLREDRHLLSHLEAMQRLQQSIQTLDQPAVTKGFARAKTQPSKPVNIEFNLMAGLYRFRSTPKEIQLQLSEGFIAADEPVFNALAHVIRFGKSAKTTQIISRFSCSEEFSEILLAMDLLVGEMADASQGHIYNLETIFDRVNGSYFHKTLPKPQLAWSQTFTQRKYGHYEPARDRVVLSRTLDDKRVPSEVVEFVMYHELLHKHQGEVWVNGRQRVHTPAFRREERKFKHYDLAQTFLAQLAAAQ
jgi:hypothetical protein